MITQEVTDRDYSRESLFSRYKRVREHTETLCQPLAKEDYIPQPIPDVSPPRWNLAHTTWFFETFILDRFINNYQWVDRAYNYLFNSYYESAGPRWKRSNRGQLSRPTVEEVFTFRHTIDKRMDQLFEDAPERQWLSIAAATELGLQHEQQHQELLLTDLKYSFCINPVYPRYNPNELPQAKERSVPERYIEFEGGLYTIGFAGEGFAFDNEFKAHKVYLRDFRLRNKLVTNAKYKAFIGAGGYRDFNYWLKEGWEWVQENERFAPLYWRKKDDDWYEATLNELRPLEEEAPVTHLSYYEADAFARWAGKRLPTEAEWEVATQLTDPDPGTGNFLEDGCFHPQPPPQPSKEKPVQLLGDCWEWTQSAYLPYPGYKREEGAFGEYNGKFMVNQMVLRGGSCVTPRDHIRLTYRNFFHPDKNWQFTGIRLAE